MAKLKYLYTKKFFFRNFKGNKIFEMIKNILIIIG